MEFTKENLSHLATLAALKIDDAELDSLRASLSAILAHVDELSVVDTSSVEATTSVLLEKAPLREDKRLPSLATDEVLRSAPRAGEGGFLVPVFVES